PARDRAFTPKNIKAGFAASGLFPFNPDRVLRSMPAPPVEQPIPSADEKSSALSVLQEDRIQFLTTINNEAKVRRSTKSLVLEARGKRGRKRKSSTLEAEEDTAEENTAEEDTAGSARRGRKRKSAALDAPTLANKKARISNGPKSASTLMRPASRIQIADDEIVPEPWRAPVAKMW
ncbi:hypothetical protein LARI1_G008576, partial [Lachnellula arida]